MPVSTTRELLVIDLRTYGEDAVAAAVMHMSEETRERIFDRADHCVYADAFTERHELRRTHRSLGCEGLA